MRNEFCLDPELVYLNHAGVGPWPRRTAEAVKAFAEENARLGTRHYPRWLQLEAALRGQLRTLINAPSDDDIALLKNTSEALSMVAYGLPWRAGDNLIISDQEFPSNRIVWESLRDQGVEVRVAALGASSSPEQAVMDLADRHTRLVAISAVQYATGLRMDLEPLGAFCRARDILFCVDAIQQIGALPFDAQAIQADFVAADGHKWMLAPEGLALFYCRAEVRERLRLTQYGWHMVEAAGNYDTTEWEPARSARRFECGSPNMIGIHGLNASLALLLETGMEVVGERVLERSGYLIERIRADHRLELTSSAEASRRAGIVAFRHRDSDSHKLAQALNAHGVMCACRGRAVRLSPHYYNTLEELDQALDLALSLAKG